MHHNILESSDKKKQVNEQTLRERYPYAMWSNIDADLKGIADATLSELIIKLSEEVEAGNINEFKKILFNLTRTTESCPESYEDIQLLCYSAIYTDILIEAARDNHYKLVELLTGVVEEIEIDPVSTSTCKMSIYKVNFHPAHSHIMEVSEDIIEKYIKDNKYNKGNTINAMELTLCAKDIPTEVLNIICHITSCTSLLLNNYFYHSIYLKFIKANNANVMNSAPTLFGHPSCPDIKDAITSIKFLCGVIGNFSIIENEARKIISRIKTTISGYKDMICKYYPQAEQELQLFHRLEQSVMGQEKGHGSKRPCFG